jgi:hypothetical protein
MRIRKEAPAPSAVCTATVPRKDLTVSRSWNAPIPMPISGDVLSNGRNSRSWTNDSVMPGRRERSRRYRRSMPASPCGPSANRGTTPAMEPRKARCSSKKRQRYSGGGEAIDEPQPFFAIVVLETRETLAQQYLPMTECCAQWVAAGPQYAFESRKTRKIVSPMILRSRPSDQRRKYSRSDSTRARICSTVFVSPR